MGHQQNLFDCTIITFSKNHRQMIMRTVAVVIAILAVLVTQCLTCLSTQGWTQECTKDRSACRPEWECCRCECALDYVHPDDQDGDLSPRRGPRSVCRQCC